MNYIVCVGSSDKLEESQIVCSCSKLQHERLFEQLKTGILKHSFLFEMKDYDELVNLFPAEIEQLLTDIYLLLPLDEYKDNALLRCLLHGSERAIELSLELICYGEDK